MRIAPQAGPLRAKVFAGTHVVLMALDLEQGVRPGLRGFAIKRGRNGQPQEWLRGIKYFTDLVPQPAADGFVAYGGAAACTARVAEYRAAGVDLPVLFPMPVDGDWGYEKTITAMAGAQVPVSHGGTQ